MATNYGNFREFFKAGCGHDPYEYQCRLACGELARPAQPSTLKQGRACESLLIDIPTGLGKTAAVVWAWLWNRVAPNDPAWPRRLVYCLPMRTLVEQTKEAADKWISAVFPDAGQRPAVHILMGGEDDGRWDLHPESNAILIGTQDMLLSRALNRGYGMSRARWPMTFGLLNNDCLWVFDEVQLMGSGLPTTAQLEAFRGQFPPVEACHTWWMSATSESGWLKTVDFDPARLGSPVRLSKEEKETIKGLLQAHKPVSKAKSDASNPKALAKEIYASRNSDGITLVVINTVKRARVLWQEINKLYGKQPEEPRPLLLHSRFRPEDRTRILKQVLAAEDTPRIIVSTQVIEAGVDLSAATLFTELAAWTSLVQRFGRCNRRGKEKSARIVWIDTENCAPYTEEQLVEAKQRLSDLEGKSASPERLATIPIPAVDRPLAQQVIRRKDFLELFDTTPDLAGNDLDMDRWVREVEESSVQIFWRAWLGDAKGRPPDAQEAKFPAAQRQELCPAPVFEFRKIAKDRKLPVWRWDFLDGQWSRVRDEAAIYPGQIYLLPASAGGYTEESGWNPASSETVTSLFRPDDEKLADENDSDPVSEGVWQSIAEHTDKVCAKLAEILQHDLHGCPALNLAARWHDWGKAHAVFQSGIATKLNGQLRPTSWQNRTDIAKAPGEKSENWWKHYDRRHFRHELASALGVLDPNTILDPNRPVSSEERNLIAYLVATHHGKVRLSLRSLPDEEQPEDGRRFARGVWQDDPLPSTDVGGGVTAPQLQLSLEPMELGLCQEHPFEGQPSWTERTLRLRDTHGPFCLVYWEALLRAADMRASALTLPSP